MILTKHREHLLLCFVQVRQLCQLLQTPYQHTEPLLPPAEVEYRVIGGTTDGGGDGGEEGEGVREGEESMVGVATRSEVSRFYSKPPDWALTLCVT